MFGGYESDLRRQLLAMEIGDACEVFNARRHVVTAADIEAMIARVDDMALPLAARKNLEDALARHRQMASPTTAD